MKEQNNTTSEDYLDSLLNSIMNGGSAPTEEDSDDDLSLLGDSLDDIEGELFGTSDSGDSSLLDDDYFDKEISNEELFGLEDDTDISEAIATNDSAADDNLQGLLDVMGIDEKDNNVSVDMPKEKKKKKLFGKKKDKKAGKNKASITEESNEMVDLSALSGIMDAGNAVSQNTDNVSEPDMMSMDLAEPSLDEMPPLDDLMSVSADNEMDSTDNMPEGVSDDLSDGLSDFGGFGLDFEEPANESNKPSTSSGPSRYDDDDDELEEKDSKKGKKKKKDKKAKVKKDKKSKKAKVKDKKPKKEKKEKVKEPDEIIKISKITIFLAFTVTFVFVCSLVLGGDYYTYTKKVSKATKEYVDQNYTVAYELLFGLEMKKDDDEELYKQIQTVMYVNRHYDAYEQLIRMDEYEQGLYSLLKGVKMFDKYQNTGRKLNCYDDMQNVLGWIDRGLMETYGLTESQARELNLINNDEKYATEVCLIAQEARNKAEAEAKAAEEAAKLEKENKDKEE